MAKQTIKVKHLGLISTGKFASIFAFIFSSLMLLVTGVMFGAMTLLMMVIGGLSGSEAFLGTLMGGGVSLVMFLFMAVAFVIVYTLFGFIGGVVGAFAFNMVVKLSGGLSFDAEIV
jgi:hypothetical protein